MFQVIEESEQKELEEALAPCSVAIEFSNYDTQIGAGWKHPNGGCHALRTSAKIGVRGLIDHIKGKRHFLVARAEWAHVRDATLWQRLTMWARPKYRKALDDRQAAWEEANRKDRE